MNIKIKKEVEHPLKCYFSSKLKLYLYFIIGNAVISLLIIFLLHLFKVDDTFTVLITPIMLTFYILLYFLLDYNDYKTNINHVFYWQIIKDFEHYVADNEGIIEKLYVSEKLYPHIRHFILLFHYITLEVDPYRDGYSFGSSKKNDIIENIEDIL